jgi:outer membrane murein-binding lipoprotein Lpp
MEMKFEVLFNDMKTLKATTELTSEIRAARTLNEKLKFEEENYALKEKVNNQSYLISDLSAKVKDLENERSSLLTVVRILQTEAHNARMENCRTETAKSNR